MIEPLDLFRKLIRVVDGFTVQELLELTLKLNKTGNRINKKFKFTSLTNN